MGTFARKLDSKKWPEQEIFILLDKETINFWSWQDKRVCPRGTKWWKSNKVCLFLALNSISGAKDVCLPSGSEKVPFFYLPLAFWEDVKGETFLLLLFSQTPSGASPKVALVVKNPPANAGDSGDPGSIPGSGRCPGEGNSYPLYYSCLENPMDRGVWWATVHVITKSWTQLSIMCQIAIRILILVLSSVAKMETT